MILLESALSDLHCTIYILPYIKGKRETTRSNNLTDKMTNVRTFKMANFIKLHWLSVFLITMDKSYTV